MKKTITKITFGIIIFLVFIISGFFFYLYSYIPVQGVSLKDGLQPIGGELILKEFLPNPLTPTYLFVKKDPIKQVSDKLYEFQVNIIYLIPSANFYQKNNFWFIDGKSTYFIIQAKDYEEAISKAKNNKISDSRSTSSQVEQNRPFAPPRDSSGQILSGEDAYYYPTSYINNQSRKINAFKVIKKDYTRQQVEKEFGIAEIEKQTPDKKYREDQYGFNKDGVNFIAISYGNSLNLNDNDNVLYVKIVYLDKTEEYILKP